MTNTETSREFICAHPVTIADKTSKLLLHLINDLTAFAKVHPRLVGTSISAILESDDSITFLRWQFHIGVIYLPSVSKTHTGL